MSLFSIIKSIINKERVTLSVMKRNRYFRAKKRGIDDDSGTK